MRVRRFEYFAIGLFVGIAGGIVAGLLIAPASGAKTRSRLAGQARRVAEAARSVAERAELTAEALTGRVEHYLGKDEDVAWRKVREIREGVQRYTEAQP